MSRNHPDDERIKAAMEVVKDVKPKDIRRPDTLRYVERKLEEKGVLRMERHPVDCRGGLKRPPPKSGHGGKYTWEGPDDEVDSELNPVPPAIDPNDPNYEGEGGGEEDVGVVVGEVEVAKAAEAKQGVSRVEVIPPLTPPEQVN